MSYMTYSCELDGPAATGVLCLGTDWGRELHTGPDPKEHILGCWFTTEIST